MMIRKKVNKSINDMGGYGSSCFSMAVISHRFVRLAGVYPSMNKLMSQI
ncbi:hypothetical protein [Salibacterium sp. K-3]